MIERVSSPTLADILRFCQEEPVERVFLEDIARRGAGRFSALAERGRIVALCHSGTNVVPSGRDCGAFAEIESVGHGCTMLVGEQAAVTGLWEALRERMPPPRLDRPQQPVYVLRDPPAGGGTGLRPATTADVPLLVPACAAAHEEELGRDPLGENALAFRRRTAAHVAEGRSWVWEENGTILFKAEASAWTASAVQLQQVWVDASVRDRGYGQRGMRDLCRSLLRHVPAVCLFVRSENAPAIRLYEAIGMERSGSYRSLLF